MDQYIDMHSHILPGVDDGAADYAMSMRMLRLAAAEHIGQIILTPHHKPMRRNVSREGMQKRMEKLREAIAEEKLPLQLYSGSELYYSSELLEELEKGEACTLADTPYLLIEFDPGEAFERIRNGLYQMLSGGYRPILAHAERYRSLAAKMERVEELTQMGAYIQINAGSVTGKFGFQTRQAARQLLKTGQVHLAATDAHDEGRRGPFLKECGDYIRKKYGQEYERQLLSINPAKIIAGEYI